MQTTTNRRLSRTEYHQLRSLAASIWPVAIRVADRIDPTMSPPKGSVRNTCAASRRPALQAEGRLTPARDFPAFAQRFQGRRAA